MKDQMQVSQVDKDNTVPQSIYMEDYNHTLGLTLSTPWSSFFVYPIKIIISESRMNKNN